LSATPKTVTVRSILADRAITTQILLAFVVMVGLGLVLPTLPLFARSFGVGYAEAGLFVSATGITRLLFDLVGGTVVDRIGERRTGAIGLVVLATCSLLTALSPTFLIALIFWGIGGAGSSILFAAQYSYVLKIAPKESVARTLGLFYGSFNVGFIFGGALGGIIADRLGLAAPLVVYSCILVLAAGLYLKFIVDPGSRRTLAAGAEPGVDPEADRESGYQLGIFGRLGELFRTGGFFMAITLNFAYMWFVAAVFDTLVPLFGDDAIGLSHAGVGGMFAIAIATEFIVLYPAGSIADRRGRKVVLIPAFIGLAVVTALLGTSGSVVAMAVGMGLLGLASGFAGVPPAAVLSDVVPESSSGLGVGAYRFAGDLAFVLGPVLTGASVAKFGFKPAFVLAAVPLLLTLVIVVRTPETMKPRANPV
jgi:MFS family permease